MLGSNPPPDLFLVRPMPPQRWRVLVSPRSGGSRKHGARRGAHERARDSRASGRCASTRGRRQRFPSAATSRRCVTMTENAYGGAASAVVRRPTGGRAILHHREITYSVTGRPPPRARERESYARINRVARSRVEQPRRRRARGAPKRERARLPGRYPVLRAPRRGRADVRRGARSPEARSGGSDGALLQHGSILVDDDQTQLADFSLSAQNRVAAPGDAHRRHGASAVARRGGGRVRGRRSRARRPSGGGFGNRRGTACPCLGSRRPVSRMIRGPGGDDA